MTYWVGVVALYGSGPIRFRADSLGRARWRVLGPRPAANPLRQRRTGILIHFAGVFENRMPAP